MLCINQGWCSGLQERVFGVCVCVCVCFKLRNTFFFCPLKASNSSSPSPSSQLKGTERALSFLFSIQNHRFLAPFESLEDSSSFQK